MIWRILQSHTCNHAHTYTHAFVLTSFPFSPLLPLTRTPTHICIYTHTYTNTQTHTHTSSLSTPPSLSFSLSHPPSHTCTHTLTHSFPPQPQHTHTYTYMYSEFRMAQTGVSGSIALRLAGSQLQLRQHMRTYRILFPHHSQDDPRTSCSGI